MSNEIAGTRSLSRRKDLSGMTFGTLTPISCHSIVTGRFKRTVWKCLCSCGGSAQVRTSDLIQGRTKSCGCLRKTATRLNSTTHGMTKTGAYISWQNMKERVTNPNHPNYRHYGGRGITVCPEWLSSFPAFFRDMGPRPKGLTIERIDNDKGYCKENCKWATIQEQRRNRRDSTRKATCVE